MTSSVRRLLIFLATIVLLIPQSGAASAESYGADQVLSCTDEWCTT
jgi:hypothetical protein